MTLRIEKSSEGQKTVLRLSGRIRPEELLELKRQLDGAIENTVLDLKEVTLIDLEVAHFLSLCVSKGIELRNGAQYIHEWIMREQNRRPSD